MLDNVVEVNGLALEEQRREIENKRRHGMGFLGLGSALAMLTIPYGSPASIAFTEQVAKELALTGWREGLALAKEKGDRKSTRLNSSHVAISYAVFCLKKNIKRMNVNKLQSKHCSDKY